MAGKMCFKGYGVVCGKEYQKAKEESKDETTGRVYPAHGERYVISVLVGNQRNKSPLFEGAPTIATAYVTPSTYIGIKDFIRIEAEYEQRYSKKYGLSHTVLSVPGWFMDTEAMKLDDDEIDEDELIRAKIESGEIPADNSDKKKAAKKDKEV